jgi:hypothetical protein
MERRDNACCSSLPRMRQRCSVLRPEPSPSLFHLLTFNYSRPVVPRLCATTKITLCRLVFTTMVVNPYENRRAVFGVKRHRDISQQALRFQCFTVPIGVETPASINN